MIAANNKHLIIFAAIFFFASIFQYSLSLNNGFVWDAEIMFTQDQSIRSLSSLERVFIDPTFTQIPTDGASIAQVNYYRPVVKILHILEFQIFGDQPLGYKATNVILNGIVVALFFYSYSLQRRALSLQCWRQCFIQ